MISFSAWATDQEDLVGCRGAREDGLTCTTPKKCRTERHCSNCTRARGCALRGRLANAAALARPTNSIGNEDAAAAHDTAATKREANGTAESNANIIVIVIVEPELS